MRADGTKLIYMQWQKRLVGAGCGDELYFNIVFGIDFYNRAHVAALEAVRGKVFGKNHRVKDV